MLGLISIITFIYTPHRRSLYCLAGSVPVPAITALPCYLPVPALSLYNRYAYLLPVQQANAGHVITSFICGCAAFTIGMVFGRRATLSLPVVHDVYMTRCIPVCITPL